ncbi:polysaccharide deacetylase family protein [Rossellomorea arthrocnemi]|jgi:peptidoglycan-N-acetylglucosamine deacetylase|uniref:polysaccharide deacetylase family protein n=1 Tax=Rossellomorea arthrocnemi TaxID=2769542 RepID=UPI0019187D58|nr:polysaccharide deacetylase family protein [Rossellomorea arthrocnemi]
MKTYITRMMTMIMVLFLLLYGTYKWMNARTFQVFGNLTSEVNTDKKVVALTFDDGPTENTGKILSLLDKYKVKATFFLIGEEIERSPEEAKKIVEKGHQIGNHTYTHNRMIFKSSTYIKKEIENTDELIKETGYDGEIDFRPPNGKKLIGLPYYLHKNDRETIMWSIEPDSVTNDPSKKLAVVKENAKPGSIILLHPMYDKSVDEIQVLEEILAALTKEGYSFVTVNELQKLNTK